MSLTTAHHRSSSPTLNPTAVSPRISPVRIILFPARAFLALGWLRAGVEKLIDTGWWNGSQVRSFLDVHTNAMLPFLNPFASSVGHRAAVIISLLVLLVELAIGLCLIAGHRLPAALAAACALNITFVGLGAVTPSAFYLVLQMTLLFAVHITRPKRSVAKERVAAAFCLLLAVTMAPFIETIEPHAVIEDPAIMLSTLAMLCAATLAIITVEGRDPRYLADRNRQLG